MVVFAFALHSGFESRRESFLPIARHYRQSMGEV